MASTSVGLVQALRSYRLLEPAQLEEVAGALQSQFPDPRALARELLQRGWLTSFQVNQLLQGKGGELVLGPYVIVDRLGEGANGQVFKARHQAMNRTIALKVLRKDLLADNDAIARFYREIEVASRVSHPHIVHAYDAGPIGAAHVLAMEYVDGPDLDRLVREKGPLAIAQACDYLRQAALGLQHAHEKGLVHRDIKPSNLLVARGPTSKSKVQGLRSPLSDSRAGLWTLNFGVVKILDLGLARLQEYAQGSKTRNLTVLAGNQVLMGTPDYLSPEQALDFHTADIRSDIYSLGCTLFYLLTSQPPFPAETVPQKLMKHQQAEIPSVTAARPTAPAALEPILKRMLAKSPADRYQTPGELAADLTAFLGSLNGAGAPGVSLSGVNSLPARKSGSSLRIQKDHDPALGITAVPQSQPSLPAPVPPPSSKKRVAAPPTRGRSRRLAIGGAAALLAVLAALSVFLFQSGPPEKQGAGYIKPATPSATEVQRLGTPALIYQCGRGQGKRQVQIRREGYNCNLLLGRHFDDNWGEKGAGALLPHCWADEKEVRFQVIVPKGTAGRLRLLLVDGDNLGRKERVVVQDKSIGEYGDFGKLGKEVTIPISAEAAKTGVINIALTNLGPRNAVVSTVEFVPVLPPPSADAPRVGPAALVFLCGKGGGKDQVQLRRPGYDCKMLQGNDFDGWPGEAIRTHCWVHGQEVRFEVIVPPGTAGELHLWLVDGDNRGRQERVAVQGKTIGEYGGFGHLGQEVVVPISAEDAKNGKLVVSLANQGPENAVVSCVEFDPYLSRPRR